MRTITYYLATNQVVESDAIYPNAFSADYNTTQLIFDYTGTACATWDKWLDLTMSDYTKDVQSLGTGTIVTFNLGAEHTKKGLLQVNPYAKNGTDKHGFPIYKLTIERQLNNSTVDASVQQSMIDYFDDRLTVKAVSATTLAPGESATASVATEADGTTYVFGIPQGATGANGADGATGAKGDKGAQWRGAYSAGTAYVIDDVVSYNGSSYICILASTGNLPTNATYWSLVAQKGDNTTASAVTNTPAGNIAAITVQAAIDELDTEKQPNALIATYTHSGNREVFVSAVDVYTNTFTSVAHGLSNGNNVYPVFEDDLGATYAALVLPGGIQSLKTYPGYYVVNKTDNTFQLSLTNGGEAIDITTNASLDLTKWHFEAGEGTDLISITGLPSGLRRLRIVHRGRVKRPNSPGHISINNVYPTTNEWLYVGTIGWPISAYLGNIFHNVETIIETRGFMYVRHIGYKWDQNSTSANTGLEIRIHEASVNPSVCNVDISTVNIYNVGLANGATIEVYRL